VAESLGSAVLTVSVDDAQLKAGLQAAERQATATGRAVEKAFTPSGKSVQTAANGLQYFIDTQGRARDTAGKFLTVAQQQAAGIENVGKSAKRASFDISGLGDALAAIGIGAAAAGFLRGSVNAAVELESISKKLSNTLGEQGAGQALSFTKGLADQLGLSFKTLAGSFGSFTAAASAANVPLDQQKELFAAVAKAAQALGLSNDEINGSLLALQQVAAKGTVQMEELRGQLGERLPIAFGATAKGLGITQQELIKLVESGRLTASEFFPALTKGLNELTAGAGGSATAAQNFQKLANAFDELQTSFGKTLLPTITEQVKNLTGALSGLQIGIDANKLGLGGLFGNLGLVPDAGIEAVASVRQLAEQYQLTAEQARALFFDAAKLEGLTLTSTGFLPDAKGLERALERLPKLAEEFRAKNKDAVTELKAQAAEAARVAAEQKKGRDSVENIQEAIKALSSEQKALAVDSQRYADISQEIVNKQTRLNELKKTDGQRFAESIAAANQLRSIQEEIAIQQQRGSLTGTGIGALQAVKALEDAKRAEQDAQAALRADPGNTSLFNASQQAAANVQLSAAKTKADLEDAFRSAQDAVRSISRSIEDSVTALNAARGSAEGINKFIDPQQARERQQAANVNLLREASDLAKQLGVTATFRGGLTQRNSQINEFITAARQELRAPEDINRQYADLAKANNDLFKVNQSLSKWTELLANATQNLAEKDWNVYVNAPATADLPRGVEVYQ
jgi:tape measure domain-containing protein